jgi:hypothetical protein
MVQRTAKGGSHARQSSGMEGLMCFYAWCYGDKWSWNHFTSVLLIKLMRALTVPDNDLRRNCLRTSLSLLGSGRDQINGIPGNLTH